ncbi:phosphotransferase family protein [Nocardioides zeae]|uniref:Aminoglycoside phosphotransferase (APT) family kinase protein n=1 Tax=Nocardioides zeae TaxID=1457234 RepID=A0AAJ1U0C4_9ACTN|nr:phosphotransferase family protein [Nocardioides zeae]MDQ1105661.1 aminoglycoside phosphotransferase (APT) family kinase protein [Nocardioides zeae]
MTGAAEQHARDLGPRVAEVLRATAPGLEVGPLEVMPGGHSGLTYRLDTGEGPLVVKAVPPGQRSIGRHDMLRQARILQALADTPVAVPAVRAVDDTEPAWFAMELVEGESLEPVLDDPPVPADLAATRMRHAAAALPALHGVPIAAVPDPGPVLTPADELARWVRTMGAVPPELLPQGDVLGERLAAAVPAAVDPVLVHGDYRLGNLLSRGEHPVALIDWEIWSLGDPRVELGWFLVFADGSNFPGVGREVPGLPGEDELLGLAGGADRPDQAWFNALGRFKMAAIMGHNLRRHREGRHHDPAQEQLPATITRLIETGLDRL